MAMKRRWILPLAGAAVTALTLWGIYGVGTAGKLLPEKKPKPAAVEVLPDTEDGPVLKYDAALHRRGKPLPDPFHADALSSMEKEKAPPLAMEGKVAENFSAEAVPKPSKKEKSAGFGLPVLKGVMAYGSERRAMLEMDGNSVVVKEGERAGPWSVSEIQDKNVTLVSGGNSLTLTIR